MSKNTISESLNKGVPVWAPVNIRRIDLTTNSENPEKINSIIEKNFAKYMEFLRNLGTSVDLNVFSTMMVVIEEQTLERKLIFSPIGFISTLLFTLNYNNICKNIKEAQKEYLTLNVDTMIEPYLKPLKARISALEKVKTHKQLQREFPLLYTILEEQKERTKKTKELLKKLENISSFERIKYINELEQKQRKYIPNFSFEKYVNDNLNITIEVFVKKCASVLNNLLENSEQIFEYLMSSYIDISELGQDDQDRIELFFASQYLFEAERTTDDLKQDFLYYVSNYFASNPDVISSDLAIVLETIPENTPNYSQIQNKKGQVITARELYDRYRQILVENPNLRAIDFSHLDFTGLSASEVKEFMDEYLKDLSVNWELLAPEDKSYEEEILKKIQTSGKGMTEIERDRHQKRLLELFMEKKRLYDSSDPFFRVRGKDTFDGYIGYIYKNGRVVLDKFYEDADTGKLADGHAVYAMGIQEFYEVSKLSKSEIIKRKLCNRYIHTGTWAQRVLENEIKATPTDNPTTLIRRLIKKGKIELPPKSAT